MVTKGVVLRETETKESDKILTLLTAERGKLSVIARGARRKGCKFAAAAQSLAYSEWTLYQKGQWYYANEGTTLELFAGLRGELEKLALGCYFAELTEAVTAEETAAEELLRHLLNGLYEQPLLDVLQGVLRCGSCGGGESGLSMPLCGDSLAALRHIVYGDPKRLYSFALGEGALGRLADAAEAYTAAQLERGFRTLDFYKSLQPLGTPSKREKM